MLSARICSISLENPLILASGILDTTGEMMAKVARHAGAITTKSISLKPREGHKNPTVIETNNYMLNAIGLSNPGIKEFINEIKIVRRTKKPVIGSIVGCSDEEFAGLARSIGNYVYAVEINVSCPNITGERIGQEIGKEPESVKKIVRKVKNSVHIPIIVKLTPNVNDIAEIAKAAENAGADAITAINTLGPGMAINIEARKPILANKFGGMSGPAIKPIAIADVYKIYESVKIPIIGTGGIVYGKDAIEMLMAGASAVGIGSAVYYRGHDAFGKIKNEMVQWMRKNKVNSVREIIGAAHK